MLNKEEIENILEANEDIITYKADKDFRCLTSTEKALLENNKKIKEYIKHLEQKESILNKVTDKLKEVKEIAEEDKEQKKIIELPNGIRYEDKVISLDTFIYVIDNLLNIIEGEKE